jgi:hypothetical protein
MKAFWIAMWIGLVAPGLAGAQPEKSGPDAAKVEAAKHNGDADKKLTPARIRQIEAAYHALPKDALDGKQVETLPTDERFVRIDVSERIRSASFGHKTALLVPAGTVAHPSDPNTATEFYIEHGRSTNTPLRWFGPFSVEPPPTK